MGRLCINCQHIVSFWNAENLRGGRMVDEVAGHSAPASTGGIVLIAILR